jgi:hypothetical protein
VGVKKAVLGPRIRQRNDRGSQIIDEKKVDGESEST